MIQPLLQRIAQAWAVRANRKSGLWRWLGHGLTLIAIVYLFFILSRGELKLQQVDWAVYGSAILVSLGVYLISLLIQFFIWSRLISFHRKASWTDLNIYSQMILMRSLPGGAWHWIGRISMYSAETEIPTRVVVLGNFLEWGLLILTGAGITLALTRGSTLWILLSALAVVAAFSLAFAWQSRTLSWWERAANSLQWLFLFCLVWLAGSAILYLFVQAVAGPGRLDWVEALRVWAFSGSVSLLIVFLPSSLGVREASLILLLQPGLPVSMALLTALLIRIVFIIADLLWGIAGVILSQAILRRKAFQTSA
jgi:hypothetical protein